MANTNKTHVQEWDIIRNNLAEEFDGSPHVFKQVLELSGKYMRTHEGNLLPQNGQEYFDRLEDRMTKMKVLDFLIEVVGKLNLHTDMGTVSQEQVLRGYKENLEECQRAEVEDEEESRKFVGRKKYIDDIVKIFEDDRNIYKGVSIFGMGGLGKTTLANHICRKMKQKWRIVKVNLREVSILKDMLKYIFEQLTSQTLRGGDEEQILQLIKEFLDKARECKTILMLDNIEGVINREGVHKFREEFLDKLMDCLKDDKCKIRLLLTSRLSLTNYSLLPCAVNNVLKWVKGHDSYGVIIEKELLPFKPSEAVELFSSYMGEKHIALKHAERIVRLCGWSPIAITILCKSMLYDGLTPESVIKDLEPNFWFRWFWHISKTPNITECLERSFNSLEENAQNNLIQLSVFHSASFDFAAAAAVFQTTSSTPRCPDDTKTKLDFLALRSFIEVSMNNEKVRYSLHPLVFRLVQSKIQSEQFQEVFQIAKEGFVEYYIKIICGVAEEMDRNCIEGYAILGYDMKHINNFYELMATKDMQQLPSRLSTDSMETIVESRRIYEIADILLYDDTKWSLIQNFITKTKANVESRLHHFFWRTCEIAVLLDLDRNLEASKKIDQLENELLERKLGKVNNAMSAVEGSFLFQKGRYYRREYDCERAIQILKLAEGQILKVTKDHEILLSKIYNVMGGSEYRKAKPNYAEARRFHEKALEIIESQKKWLNIERPEYLQNIGTCLFKEGESLYKGGEETEAKKRYNKMYQEAIEMYDKAIELSETMKLDEMDCHAQILQNRGEVHCAMGRWDKALDDLSKSLILRQKILSPHHRKLTIVGFKLAQLFYKKGVWLYHKNNKDAARESMLWGKWLCVKIAEVTTKGGLPINDVHYQEVKELTFKLLDTLQDPKTFGEIQNKYRDFEKGAFDKQIRKSCSIKNSYFTQNRKYGTTCRESTDKMHCDSNSDSLDDDDDDDYDGDDAANQHTGSLHQDDTGVPLYKMTEREKAVDLTGVTYVGNTRFIGYDQHFSFSFIATPKKHNDEDINIEDSLHPLIPDVDTKKIEDDGGGGVHLNRIIEQGNINSCSVEEDADRDHDTCIQERTCIDIKVIPADIHSEQQMSYVSDPAPKKYRMNKDDGNVHYLVKRSSKDSSTELTEHTTFIQKTRKRKLSQTYILKPEDQ